MTLEASIEALTDYIDRIDSHVDRMERIAAFIPGAIGVIATVGLARLNTDVSGVPAYVGILAAGVGMRAVFDAIACLSQYRMIGIPGYGELWKVNRDYASIQTGRISMLIAGVRQANYAAAQKRRHVRLALMETAVAVLFL